MKQFGRFSLGSVALGALAVSTRWTILPLTPSTSDYFVVSLALGALWSYTGELFLADPSEQRLAASGVAPAPESLKPAWTRTLEAVLAEATLKTPASAFAHKGGKSGRHTEALGFILAEMQFLPRAYPDARW